MTRHRHFQRSSHINAPLSEVFSFFSDPRNLAKLTPPSMGFSIVDAPDRPLQLGDRITYRIRVGGIRLRWQTLIASWHEGESFSDLQERGPYRFWLHTHTFREVSSGIDMDDSVEYELPLGRIGALLAGWFVRRQLRAIFDFREAAITRIFP